MENWTSGFSFDVLVSYEQNLSPSEVKFSDFAKMLGVQPFAHYGRIVGSDNYWVEEDMQTLMHPQVVLAWMLNDAPIPPKTRRAASPGDPVPLRSAEPQSDYGDLLHLDILPHNEAATNSVRRP